MAIVGVYEVVLGSSRFNLWGVPVIALMGAWSVPTAALHRKTFKTNSIMLSKICRHRSCSALARHDDCRDNERLRNAVRPEPVNDDRGHFAWLNIARTNFARARVDFVPTQTTCRSTAPARRCAACTIASSRKRSLCAARAAASSTSPSAFAAIARRSGAGSASSSIPCMPAGCISPPSVAHGFLSLEPDN